MAVDQIALARQILANRAPGAVQPIAAAPMAPQAHMPPPPMPGFDPRAMAAPMAPAAPRPMLTQEQIEAEEGRLARERALTTPGAQSAATPAAARMILQAQNEAGKPKIFGPPPEANENERRVYTTKPIEMTGRAAPAGVGGAGPRAAAAPKGPAPMSLKQVRQADEKKLVASYDDEQAAMRRGNNAELVQQVDASDRTRAIGDDLEARATEEQAQQRDYEFVRRTFRDQTEDMVDKLRKREVDPQRLYGKPSFGSSVAIALGGALSGMYAGMSGRAGNDFVDTINRNIDRDISAQEGQIANEKTAIGERQNLYGQMIASHKDSTLARAQTKNAMWEAAKVQLDAEATRLGTDVARANADRGIGLIGRKQIELQRDLDAAEEQAAARAAAARAAAAAAREKMLFERGVKLEELRQGNRKIDIDEAKEGGGGGRFVATGNDPVTGAPTGYVARDKESAGKQADGIAATSQVIDAAKRILARREEQGKLGRFTSRGDGSPLGTPKWKTENNVDAALMKAQANKALGLGTMDAGTAPILDALAGNPNQMDVLGDEQNDKLRAFIAANERNLDIAKRGTAGQLAEKRIDERGREVIVPSGRQLAPANPRAVQRYNGDGTPKQ